MDSLAGYLFDLPEGPSSILLGDFNNGPEINNAESWEPGLKLLESYGLRKIIFDDGPATHIHNRGGPKEIDHVFVGNQVKATPAPLLPFEQVPKSDHRPLVVDIQI